ncbi:hypothetical protein Smar_1100 [Staphylothermus marinus F1]|uniref:Mechanosensitive ion channel n=1 Tax=Staphylothermus marinus (strain ATCC 43588 / DSM 3639 / JCM 9404 / F1) TaxID=399550 RepID=A3DNI6_STAMF|nr:hypothetical protein Smar_1100 [Staphylothermus marinus F1]
MTINTTNLTIEGILFSLQSALIVTLLVVLVRFIINRFLTVLFDRGVITISTKSTVMRFVDLSAILVILVAFLQALVSPPIVIYAVLVFAFIAITLFYYELREFVAYINLQLIRHMRGRNYEIYLPNHHKPIYGRIVSVELTNTIIEDIYGRRIYVSNSSLTNAIIKEYVPVIQLRLKLSHAEGDPIKVIEDITASLREIDTGIFRLDDKKILIDRIGGGEVIARINAYPLSIPLRFSDLVKLADLLSKSLAKYNPIIEFIELG